MASKYILSLPFLLFSGFASFAIFAFSQKNGTFDLVNDLISAKVLAGSSGEALRTTYTGIEAIDGLLASLTTFFFPIVSNSNATLSLHSAVFTGAFGSAWVLVVLESWRAGNSRKLFSFSSIFGIGAQIMTYAFSTPIFLGLQLLTSNVSFQPTAKSIAIPTIVVDAIPVVFIVAYTVPSFAMLLPAPEMVTFDQKQILIALWQPWPAYVSFLLTLISAIPGFQSASNAPLKLRKSLRSAYTFALSYTAINHVVGWTISLASVVAPVLFNAEYLHSLHPNQVFNPHLPFSSDYKVESIAEGVHIFLQWDFLIGSSAVLLWAVIVNTLAQYKVNGKVCWLGFVFKVANSLVLTGPIGTAVRLVWERDELVLDDEILKDAARKAI